MNTIAGNIIKTAQKIVIRVLLFFLYIFGFGVTHLFTMILGLINFRNRTTTEDSFWIDADGYAENMEDCLRQS